MRKLLAMLLVLCGTVVQAGEITIVGKGEAKAEPDRAMIVFTVSVTAPKMEDAVKSCNKDMQSAYVLLEKTFQIERKNIQTSQFNLSIIYAEPAKEVKETKIVGYRAANRISISLIDIKQLSDVLENLSKTPGSVINGVFFTPSDELRQKMLITARDAAMKDAIEKAKQYSEGVNLKLGKAKTITEGREEPGYRQYESVSHFADRGAGGTPISGGETKFIVSVQVVFELLP